MVEETLEERTVAVMLVGKRKSLKEREITLDRFLNDFYGKMELAIAGG